MQSSGNAQLDSPFRGEEPHYFCIYVQFVNIRGGLIMQEASNTTAEPQTELQLRIYAATRIRIHQITLDREHSAETMNKQ